jgi:hypothetical protein
MTKAIPPASTDPQMLLAYRFILALAGISFGLLLVIIFLLQRPAEESAASSLHSSPELRRLAIRELVAEVPKLFDSHVDADVGRVGLPYLEGREDRGGLVSTNRFGMREREYELPKPAGTIRIVLLGDSMIFGLGSPAEERLGVYLEGWLKDRVPDFDGEIECLHLGVASWNLAAETTWLRRQLSQVDPDLVFHLIVPNDLDDNTGTRGFGAQASFSPSYRHRADSVIDSGFPIRVLGSKKVNYLRLGLDYESQHRYRSATQEVQRLSREVERGGGLYRLLVHFRKLIPVAHEQLGRHLDPRQVVYLSKTFGTDRRYNLSKRDPHWNQKGHRKVAQLLYGLIVRDNLLPRLSPPAWAEAAQVLQEIAEVGRKEAEQHLDEAGTLALYGSTRISESLDFTALDPPAMAQVNGGIDAESLVSPYASFFLKNAGAMLRIVGRTLERPELDGAKVRIFADAEFLGDFEIRAGQEIDRIYTVPESLAGRTYLSIRFEAKDYVYQGPDSQHCVVFRLDRLASLHSAPR